MTLGPPPSPFSGPKLTQSSEIKVSANQTTRLTTITLPCGQTRAMTTTSLMLLVKRLQAAIDYLDKTAPTSKEF